NKPTGDHLSIRTIRQTAQFTQALYLRQMWTAMISRASVFRKSRYRSRLTQVGRSARHHTTPMVVKVPANTFHSPKQKRTGSKAVIRVYRSKSVTETSKIIPP